MKKVFLVFSLLALSESNVFGVDSPETLNAVNFEEAEVENQRNLGVMNVAVKDSSEQSRKRKRGAEDEKPRKRARADQSIVDQVMEIISFVEGQSMEENQELVALIRNADPQTQKKLFTLMKNYKNYTEKNHENLPISDIVFLCLKANPYTIKNLFTLIKPYSGKSTLKTGFYFVKNKIFPVLRELSKLDNLHEISYVPFSETPQARTPEHNEVILRKIVSELEHCKHMSRAFETLPSVPLLQELRNYLNIETAWLGYGAERLALENVEALFNDDNKARITERLVCEDEKKLWLAYFRSIRREMNSPEMKSSDFGISKLRDVVHRILKFVSERCGLELNWSASTTQAPNLQAVPVVTASAPFQPPMYYGGVRCNAPCSAPATTTTSTSSAPVTTTTSASAVSIVPSVLALANGPNVGFLPVVASTFPLVASAQASSTASTSSVPNQQLSAQQLSAENAKIFASELELIEGRYFKMYHDEMTPEEVIGLFQGNTKITNYRAFNAQKVLDLINCTKATYDERYQKIMEKIEFIKQHRFGESEKHAKDYLLIFMADLSLRLKHNFFYECKRELRETPRNFITFVQKHTKKNLVDIHPVLEDIDLNSTFANLQKFSISELDLSEKLITFLEALESKFQDSPIFMVILNAFVELLQNQNANFMNLFEKSIKSIDNSSNAKNESQYLRNITWVFFHLNPDYDNLKRLSGDPANTAFVKLMLKKNIDEICCKLNNKYVSSIVVESKKKFPESSIEELFKNLYVDIQNPFDSEGLFQVLNEIFEHFPEEVDRKGFVFDNLKMHFNIKEPYNSMYI